MGAQPLFVVLGRIFLRNRGTSINPVRLALATISVIERAAGALGHCPHRRRDRLRFFLVQSIISQAFYWNYGVTVWQGKLWAGP